MTHPEGYIPRNSTIINEIRPIKEAITDSLLALEGVHGVDINLKTVKGQITTTHAIVVHVCEKRSDLSGDQRIPQFIQGIPTDIVESSGLTVGAGPGICPEKVKQSFLKLGSTVALSHFAEAFLIASVYTFGRDTYMKRRSRSSLVRYLPDLVLLALMCALRQSIWVFLMGVCALSLPRKMGFNPVSTEQVALMLCTLILLATGPDPKGKVGVVDSALLLFMGLTASGVGLVLGQLAGRQCGKLANTLYEGINDIDEEAVVSPRSD